MLARHSNITGAVCTLTEKWHHLIIGNIVYMSVCALLHGRHFSRDHTVQLGLTGMVPAASGGAASPPCAVELHCVPVAETVLTQSVRGQVADL